MVFMESQRVRVVVRNSSVKISFRGGKERAARAARLFLFFQPIKSLVCGEVVAVVVFFKLGKREE